MRAHVAIIVPFFNAADTLPRLVDALLAQTHRDFVALFVDDGSTDGGNAFVKSLVQNDARFVLLGSTHAGPGPARNVGLSEADRLGVPYVTFVDADDVPEPEMLAVALKAMEGSGADIVHYQWSSELGGAPHKDSIGKPSIYVWNKLYRRAAIADIRFIDAKFGEDLTFYFETEARRVRRLEVPCVLYAHVKRGSSLWESRTEDDYSRAVLAMIQRMETVVSDTSCPRHLAADWYGLMLPKALKQWHRLIRRVPREKREARWDAYVQAVASVRFPFGFAIGFWLRHLGWRVLRRIKGALVRMDESLCMWAVRRRYARTLVRLNRTKASSPVRVVFHVTEVSKWKCKSFYGALDASVKFSPCVLPDLTEGEMRLPSDRRRAIYDERRRYFADRGYTVLDGYDVESGRYVPATSFGADVFVYQQPWGMGADRRPKYMSRSSLCLYVPYYVVSPGDLELDCALPFHRMMHTVFVPNAEFAILYGRVCGNLPRTCRFVGSGNPMMDEFTLKSSQKNAGWVIYAPHWTFRHPNHRTVLKIGTFSENGRSILTYAQHHPEIKWVFKPHPCLKGSLVSSGAMTLEEADAYYEAWGRIGRVCLDSDYPALFNESRALITDCGSFIAEYGATGKPLIYLVSRENKLKPPVPFRPLWDVLYTVRTEAEMWQVFKDVLEHDEDPQRLVRVDMARQLGLGIGGAGKRIVEYLERAVESCSGAEKEKEVDHD